MKSELKKYTEANRAAWNEVMPWHQKSAQEKWDLAFLQPGFICLDQTELELLRHIGVNHKNIAHLCCNNGIELMSLKNLGAGICVGFDIADEAIEEATQRAERSHIDCQFIRTDIYDIGAEYANQFDLVYISVGCLGWMPDLKLFFGKAAALLRENGQIFIHEIHPFSELLPLDGDTEPDSLRIVASYFKAEPHIDSGGLDYIGHSPYTAATTRYWFVHKFSDILMGLIDNHIAIEHFSEYEKDISAVFQRTEQAQAGVPLSYIMIGKKHNHAINSIGSSSFR